MSLRIPLFSAAIFLSGCASIDLPSLDMLDGAFRDSMTDLQSFPDVREAPVAPGDMRASTDWDAAARTIATQRDNFDAPPAPPEPEMTAAEIEALKARVRAYRLDDPA